MFKKLSIISFVIFVLGGSIQTFPLIDRLPFDIAILALILPLTYSVITLLKTFSIHKSFIVFTLFWLTAFSGVLINDFDTQKSFNFLAITAVCFIVPTYLLKSKQDINKLFNTFLFISIFICLFSFTSLDSLQLTGRLRLENSNPIWLSRALSVAVLWALLLTLNGRMKKRWFWLITIPFMTSMLLTGSRTPVFALLIALFVLHIKDIKFLFRTPLRIAGTLFSVLILIPITLFSISRLPQTALDRFINLSDPQYILEMSRIELYQIAANLFAQNPMGIGMGNFSDHSIHPYPHNLLLESFSELGWIFGLLFTALIIFSFIVLAKNSNNSLEVKAIYGLFLISLINAMFSGDLTSPKELYISIALSFYIYYKKDFKNIKTKVYDKKAA